MKQSEVVERARRVVIFGFPSHGHTGPLLLLAAELVEAGHEVVFYNTDLFARKIAETGATFVDYRSPAAVGGSQPMNCSTLDLDELYAEATAIHREVWPALCRSPAPVDVVIYDQFALWGRRFAAERRALCLCSSTFLLTTPEYWKSHFPAEKLRADPEAWEEFTACLSGASADGIVVYTPREMQLTAAAGVPGSVFYLGDRFAEALPPSTAELGERSLVYVSFGTVFNCNVALLRFLIEYFGRSGHRLIVSAGGNREVYAQLRELSAHDHVEIHVSVDQIAVLQQASLFIAHGGINSMYESVYLTVPLVIFPQMEEQRLNARKLEELGVAYCVEANEVSQREMDRVMATVRERWRSYKEAALAVRRAILGSANAREVARQIASLVGRDDAARRVEG